jgi:hypothetical protein
VWVLEVNESPDLSHSTSTTAALVPQLLRDMTRVVIDAERRAHKASVGKDPWWEKTDGFSIMNGTVLSKAQTPFAILWGDYDVQVKPK